MKLFKIIALFLALQSMSYCYDLGQIREQIRFRVHDTTGTINGTRWDDRNINTRIDLMHRQICNYTECLYTNVLINAVTEQAEYALPADLKRIDRVSFCMVGSTVNYKKLIAKSMASLDKDYPAGWEMSKGLPTNYYKRNMKMGLYPKTSGVYSSTRAISVDYYQLPYRVAADTDTFFGGNSTLTPYENMIISGVSADLLHESGEDYAPNLADYNQWLGLMKDLIKIDTDRSDYIPITYSIK